MSEDAGVVTISKNGSVTIPAEVREVLSVKDQEALLRLPHVEVAERSDGGSSDQVESAGIVKMSEDGVVVIPVEVRTLLGIKGEKTYIRLKNITVGKKLAGDDGSE
jgi:bifunctional DNA-binding transcriptional regulator/antitoxin component of YhaV-PrlF toxin-antitoxin module